MTVGKYARLFDLTGKVVMSAGGGGAIGAELAHAVSEFGAKVAIADLSDEACARQVELLTAKGGEAMGVRIDVTDANSVSEGVKAIEQRFGPIDVLINTVGTHIEQAAHEVTLEAWDTVVDINLRGAFVLSQAAARSMIDHETGGSIIHVTSVRSALGIRRGYAAYCASKGGLANLINQLASEWAQFGIRVNGIAPTFVRTALVAKYLDDPEFYNALVSRIPMGRVGETDDVAGLAVFLAADASSFITGQNIFIDGGVTSTQ